MYQHGEGKKEKERGQTKEPFLMYGNQRFSVSKGKEGKREKAKQESLSERCYRGECKHPRLCLYSNQAEERGRERARES